MMVLPRLKYTLDNVVVGWREEAVAYARARGYHLIINSDQRPFHYFVGHQTIKNKWYEGIFDLGMRSLLPVPFGIHSMRIEKDCLKVVTAESTSVTINFNTLHVFDLDNIVNINVEEVIEDYVVHDMFDIVEGSRLGKDLKLKFRDDLLQEILVVTSNRIDRNRSGEFKDIITKSIISYADIKNFDFSETMVRLLLERRIKEHSFKRPGQRPFKFRHSFRHSSKNKFSFKVVGDLDKRIFLHA